MPALPPGIPTSNLVLMLQTTASPALYNAVANLGDFTGPTQQTTTVNTSKHGDKFMNFVACLIDPGTLSAPCWFDPSRPTLAGNAQALAELLQSRSFETYLIAFVDDAGVIVPTTGPQLTFNAYVSKFSLKEPVNGVYQSDTEFRLSGPLEYLWPSTVMPVGQAIP